MKPYKYPSFSKKQITDTASELRVKFDGMANKFECALLMCSLYKLTINKMTAVINKGRKP